MHIFLATDGSVSARFAQAQVLALPWRTHPRITVMMALDEPLPTYGWVRSAAIRTNGTLRVFPRPGMRGGPVEVLEKVRLAMEENGASVATRIHEGPPGPTIVNTASACRADLVVVGSRGLGEYKGFLLGSVSDYVATQARCSVLLVKTPPGRERRFLCAVGDSAHAEAVLWWMKEFDLSSGAWIHQVMVVRSPDSPLRLDGPGRCGTRETRLHAWLASGGSPPVGPEIPEVPGVAAQAVRVTASVRCGQEVPEILAAVRDFRPEILVLGAGGRGSPDGSSLGAVTRKLIHLAPCSVLVLRP